MVFRSRGCRLRIGRLEGLPQPGDNRLLLALNIGQDGIACLPLPNPERRLEVVPGSEASSASHDGAAFSRPSLALESRRSRCDALQQLAMLDHPCGILYELGSRCSKPPRRRAHRGHWLGSALERIGLHQIAEGNPLAFTRRVRGARGELVQAALCFPDALSLQVDRHRLGFVLTTARGRWRLCRFLLDEWLRRRQVRGIRTRSVFLAIDEALYRLLKALSCLDHGNYELALEVAVVAWHVLVEALVAATGPY